jgi:hypothetical protein
MWGSINIEPHQNDRLSSAILISGFIDLDLSAGYIEEKILSFLRRG